MKDVFVETSLNFRLQWAELHGTTAGLVSTLEEEEIVEVIRPHLPAPPTLPTREHKHHEIAKGFRVFGWTIQAPVQQTFILPKGQMALRVTAEWREKFDTGRDKLIHSYWHLVSFARVGNLEVLAESAG